MRWQLFCARSAKALVVVGPTVMLVGFPGIDRDPAVLSRQFVIRSAGIPDACGVWHLEHGKLCARVAAGLMLPSVPTEVRVVGVVTPEYHAAYWLPFVVDPWIAFVPVPTL